MAVEKATAFYNAIRVRTGGLVLRRRRAKEETGPGPIKSVCIDYVYCTGVNMSGGSAERNTRANPLSITLPAPAASSLIVTRKRRWFPEVAR